MTGKAGTTSREYPPKKNKRKLRDWAIPANVPGWLREKIKVPVPVAAEVVGVSEDTFRRSYPELIINVSPRRQAVELGTLFAISPTKPV